MSEQNKHTVYIDIDDEITAIIEKVKLAPSKIVALVLPKRATVLQSIVNMKLLKKSAQSAKKSLVLITSEAGLMPLAGVVGLHVAKSLQSKPIIPLPPDRENAEDTDISEAEDEDIDVDKTKSVGALADAKNQDANDDDTETIELNDVNIDDATDVPNENIKKSNKLAKKFKIPNFDRFRLSFFLVIFAIILLAVGWVMAFIVLPKATVVIQTDTTTITTDVKFTASTTIKDLNLEQGLVPAVLKEIKKTDSEKATPTGKKDKGLRATGSVVLSIACANVGGSPPTVPAGTGVSSGGQTFITDSATSLTTPAFAPCRFYGSTTLTAQKSGPEFNLASGQTFAVAGYSSVTGSNAEALTGGTSNVVTTVTQGDIDTAVNVMKSRQVTTAVNELDAQLRADSLKGLDETKAVSEPLITPSAAVGAETTGDVTVTSVTTYNILGVKQDYLSQLVKRNSTSKVDTSKQTILDDGVGAAVIHLASRKSPTEVQMNLHALVVAGPQLDAAAIKDQIRGMKRGDAEKLISSKPGVKDATITYKPFWVLSTPKSVKKITVTIEKPLVVQQKGSQTTNGTNP
jgi:hypothetical protein